MMEPSHLVVGIVNWALLWKQETLQPRAAAKCHPLISLTVKNSCRGGGRKRGLNIDCLFLNFQVFDIGRYQESLAAYFALGQHQHINQILEILLGETRAYVFFERSHGDMHSFVRTCKKLREDEAARLFYQIASAVAHCHDNGLVLRDLKLRKFVFKNEDR